MLDASGSFAAEEEFTMSLVSVSGGIIRRYRHGDRKTVWALSQIPHIGATADPSVPLDLERDDPGPWGDLWDIEASHIEMGGDFLVYELDGRVVGMGAVMPDDEGTAEVNHVRVHPALRRRGIGRAVMQALEQRAIELGCVRTHLDTTVAQPEAIAFYRSLGYEETGREKYPDWELVFFTKQLGADKITTLNPGLTVGDVELARRQVRARSTLIEKLREALASDERVAAVWAHGSLGRGEEDVLSDIDLIVMTVEGAAESFIHALPDVVSRVAPVALANPMPVNAPEDGYFVGMLYDVEPFPIGCDWSVWSYQSIRPADVRVIHEREPERFVSGGTYDEIMQEIPRGALFIERFERLSTRLFMALPIAKDTARGWTDSVQAMVEYLPFDVPPARSMADLIAALQQLVDDHADEEPPSAVAAIRRYLSGVERLLPAELRR